MKIKNSKIITIIITYAFLIFTAKTVFAGLGISPSQMISSNLSKGSHVESTFVLSRSDPTQDFYFKVTLEGPAKDWVTLDKGMEFTMPAGQQRFPITVLVDVPKDAATGEYKGGIRMVSSSKASNATSGNGASTALSSLIQTDFTVTGDQILAYDVSSIGIHNIEEGSPLDVSLTINNTGNVAARPTKVHVEVLDKLDLKLLESSDITEMGSVASFKTGDISLAVPTKLSKDQYWAKISAYRDDTLLKEQNLVFEIVKVGDLNKSGDLKELICNKNASVGEIVKITGVLENNGKSNYSAKLAVEILKNGKLIKLLESDPLNVPVGKTENLFVYFTPEDSGNYTVKAHVSFSGGSSQEKDATISVRTPGVLGLSTSRAVMLPTAIIAALLLVGSFLLVVYFKKRKGSK